MTNCFFGEHMLSFWVATSIKVRASEPNAIRKKATSATMRTKSRKYVCIYVYHCNSQSLCRAFINISFSCAIYLYIDILVHEYIHPPFSSLSIAPLWPKVAHLQSGTPHSSLSNTFCECRKVSTCPLYVIHLERSTLRASSNTAKP